jgi:hypothetical protein
MPALGPASRASAFPAPYSTKAQTNAKIQLACRKIIALRQRVEGLALDLLRGRVLLIVVVRVSTAFCASRQATKALRLADVPLMER